MLLLSDRVSAIAQAAIYGLANGASDGRIPLVMLFVAAW